MRYQIIFHPLADKEFKEAYRWYEERLPGLKRIVANPLLYPKVRSNYREAKADKFPYVIVYRVNPKKKIIFFSAVHHTFRNPRKKYRK